MSGVLCSRHQLPMYSDVRDGKSMGRWLCPEPGCTAALADEQLVSVREQAWCEDNGMTAPGWRTLTVGGDPMPP